MIIGLMDKRMSAPSSAMKLFWATESLTRNVVVFSSLGNSERLIREADFLAHKKKKRRFIVSRRR